MDFIPGTRIPAFHAEWLNNCKEHVCSRKVAHEAFKALRAHINAGLPLPADYLGICANVCQVYLKGEGSNLPLYSAVTWYGRNWKNHSGNISYPVPRNGRLPWHGENKTLRMDLLNHLIRATR